MARNEIDKLPTWISPVVEYTFFICQMGSETQTKLENAFDQYALQYFVTLKRDIFAECLGKHDIVCEIVDSTIILHCSDDRSPDRVYSIMNELLKRTYDYVIDLRSPDGHKFSSQIRKQGPMQVIHRSAIVIKYGTKMICVSESIDCLDRMLVAMGYKEVEYLDAKQFGPNLRSLGIEDASLHPNIQSIEVQHSQQKCSIAWSGRAKETGDVLICKFLKQFSERNIEFVGGEQRRSYTELACKIIFDERGNIKHHYAQYLTRTSKTKKICNLFSLVQKDGKLVLYGRDENVDILKKEIEKSVSKHFLEKKLFEQTDVLIFFEKHKEEICYDIVTGTLLCTNDLTSEVIKLCTPRTLRQKFEVNIEPELLVTFLQRNGGDLLELAKRHGVDILFDGKDIILESSLNDNCKEIQSGLQKAIADRRMMMPVDLPFMEAIEHIQTIMDKNNCSWRLHCNNPKAVISSKDLCKSWMDPYGSTKIWIAEMGTDIPCTDIGIVFTADMFRYLGISNRTSDEGRSKTFKEGYGDIEIFHGPFSVSNTWVSCREIHLVGIKVTENKSLMETFAQEINISRENGDHSLCIVAAIGDSEEESGCGDIISQFVCAVRKAVRQQRPTYILDVYIVVDKRNIVEAEECIEISLSRTFKTFRQEKNNAKKKCTGKTMKINFIKGSITKSASDAIVSTTSKNLSLSKGSANMEIAQADGDELQNEYENVKTFVKSCLTLAEELECRSVSFPAIGVETLKYPRRETIAFVLDAIDAYKLKVKDSDITKVNMVCAENDRKTIDAFKAAEEWRRSDSCKVSPEKGQKSFKGQTIVSSSFHSTNVTIVSVDKYSYWPSFAVHVKFSKELKGKKAHRKDFQLKKAIDDPVTWNDEIHCKTIESLKTVHLINQLKGILNDERITFLIWNLDSKLSMSYSDQIVLTVSSLETMLKPRNCYLQNVVILLDDSSAIESLHTRIYYDNTISWHLSLNEAVSGTLEMIGITPEWPLKAKEEVLQLIEETKNSRVNFQNVPKIQNEVEESQTNDTEDYANSCFQDLAISSTLNAGIVRFLGEGLTRWACVVKETFNVTLDLSSSDSVTVSGDLKNVLSFETYLHTGFPKDPVFASST